MKFSNEVVWMRGCSASAPCAASSLVDKSTSASDRFVFSIDGGQLSRQFFYLRGQRPVVVFENRSVVGPLLPLEPEI
jgi:hypothetical protein